MCIDEVYFHGKFDVLLILVLVICYFFIFTKMSTFFQIRNMAQLICWQKVLELVDKPVVSISIATSRGTGVFCPNLGFLRYLNALILAFSVKFRCIGLRRNCVVQELSYLDRHDAIQLNVVLKFRVDVNVTSVDKFFFNFSVTKPLIPWNNYFTTKVKKGPWVERFCNLCSRFSYVTNYY